MFCRVVTFLLCQVLLALAVWLVGGSSNHLNLDIALAALAGTYVWLAVDAMRGMRLLRWLRAGDTTDIALGSGLWGEVFDRIRKLVRTRDRALKDSDQRLQDFLLALQASPNGVVLLDADGRVEWLNQTAANHFGLDAKRDLLQHLGNLVRDPGFVSYVSAKNFQRDVVMPGRSSTGSKPVKLSLHVHPYGEERSLLLSRYITEKEQA